ncbi:MAG: lipocalin family protein [Maribacter sp.]|nr:lipocalin family protein [Maribacter sp.]
MKKVLILLLLLSACTSGEEPLAEASLLGKWYYDYIEVNGERTAIVQQDYGCEDIKQDYIEFTPGGGLILYFYQDCEDGYLYDTYTMNSNQITFVSGFDTTVSEIKELTQNTLILKAVVDRYKDGTLDVVVNRFTR